MTRSAGLASDASTLARGSRDSDTNVENNVDSSPEPRRKRKKRNIKTDGVGDDGALNDKEYWMPRYPPPNVAKNYYASREWTRRPCNNCMRAGRIGRLVCCEGKNGNRRKCAKCEDGRYKDCSWADDPRFEDDFAQIPLGSKISLGASVGARNDFYSYFRTVEVSEGIYDGPRELLLDPAPSEPKDTSESWRDCFVKRPNTAKLALSALPVERVRVDRLLQLTRERANAIAEDHSRVGAEEERTSGQLASPGTRPALPSSCRSIGSRPRSPTRATTPAPAADWRSAGAFIWPKEGIAVRPRYERC